jgi:LysR family transcriptional activator of mexEF-oprN operon
MEERHITRAGARLYLTQSAASKRLAQLRTYFGDSIVVQQGSALHPTARAETLYEAVIPALHALHAAIAAERPFSPGTDGRVFRIGASDLAAMLLLPRLMVRLRTEAPGCRLVLRNGDHLRMPAMLASGEVSTLVGYLGDELPEAARQRSLASMNWVTLRDARTPEVVSLDAFCSRPHAMVTPAGDLSGMVDDALKAIGRSRTVVLGVGAFAMLTAALRGTDLVAAVPEPLANAAAELGLASSPLPFQLSVSPHSLAWSATADRDPAERWFRAVVADCYMDALRTSGSSAEMEASQSGDPDSWSRSPVAS